VGSAVWLPSLRAVSSVVVLPPPAYLFSPFSDREWEVLERYARKVKALQASEFPSASLKIVATPMPIPGRTGRYGWRLGIDGPDEKEVKSVIGDFRQLYMDHNRTSARAVLKMLTGHARARDTDPSRSLFHELKELGKHLGLRKEQDPRAYVLEETSDGGSIKRSPDSIVRDWFNGVYFHDDSGPEMSRWHLQYAIKDFIEDWGKLLTLVEAVLRDPGLRSP
jgi:hypothetical protein